MLDARQDGRIADLVAIEVQDRQHGSVGDWVEKLVGLPRGGQGPCFRFTVADDAGDNQTGIVERCSESMADANTPVRRLRESTQALSARRGWKFRRGTRTA